MRTLLVTGANGWLGRSIIEETISSNYKIESLILHSNDQNFLLTKNLEKHLKKKGIRLIYLYGCLKNGSISDNLEICLDEYSISKLSIIYTSSVIHPSKKSDFFDINFYGLVKFYKNINRNKLDKFTYISSNSPFGFNPKKYQHFDEDSPYLPHGGYGESKKKAEIFLKNQNNPKKITILRAPWFHGKNMPDRQKNFLKKSALGRFPIINNGKNTRSLVNTSDLAKAALNVTLLDRKSDVYWISEKSPYSMFYILKKIQKVFCKKSNKEFVRTRYLNLPLGFSSIIFILDMIVQKVGFYNIYIHVLGELGQNINCKSEKYRNEFKNHKWTDFDESISEEIDEVFSFKN